MSDSLAPQHACHECISVNARTTAITTASVQGCDLRRCELAAWNTCAGTSGQQCSYGMHELSWMCVVQILIEAPGKAPFRLTRLGGAPHGQPALALRQVQVHIFALRTWHASMCLHGCRLPQPGTKAMCRWPPSQYTCRLSRASPASAAPDSRSYPRWWCVFSNHWCVIRPDHKSQTTTPNPLSPCRWRWCRTPTAPAPSTWP